MKAFPILVGNPDKSFSCNQGMDLRDYFAAKAMQSFLTITPEEWYEMFPESESMKVNIPKLSYEFAEEMMKAREK